MLYKYFGKFRVSHLDSLHWEYVSMSVAPSTKLSPKSHCNVCPYWLRCLNLCRLKGQKKFCDTSQSVKQGTFINVLLLIRGYSIIPKRNFFHHFHFIERLGNIFKMTKNKGRSKSTLSVLRAGVKSGTTTSTIIQ